MHTTSVVINEFDEELNIVDDIVLELDDMQIADIINHSLQLVLMTHRHSTEEARQRVMFELEESLVSAGII